MNNINTTDTEDLRTDMLIERLSALFKKRRAIRDIINNRCYKSLLLLNQNDLGVCIEYLKKQQPKSRINTITNIIDFFSESELKHHNLKSIFLEFQNDLNIIA
jgi:hypothetical protein